jgi:hypothetical protein
MFESSQTKFVAIFGIAALMIGTATTAVVHNVASSLYFLIGYLILILISIADIHCVLVGGCELLGWVKTMSMMLIFLISIVVFAYAVKLKRAEIEFDAKRDKSREVIVYE